MNLTFPINPFLHDILKVIPGLPQLNSEQFNVSENNLIS